jgi:hypothetical protein
MISKRAREKLRLIKAVLLCCVAVFYHMVFKRLMW